MSFLSMTGRPDALPPALDIPVYRQMLPRATLELRRARRYERSLALIVLSPVAPSSAAKPSLAPPPSPPLLYLLLGAFLRNSLRETDLLSSIPEGLLYTIFLPETGDAEAREAIHRLDEGFYGVADSRLRCGVAAFPEDGLVVQDLLKAARRSWDLGATGRTRPSLDMEGTNG